MPKRSNKRRNRKRFQVEFKGRFYADNNQIKPDIAFKLLEKCNKKQNLIKTSLKLIEGGFYVGTKTGIQQIKRKTFMFNSIKKFFVFKMDPKCVIVVNTINEKYFMSIIKFQQPTEFTEIIQCIEDTKAPTTSNSHNNNQIFDNATFEYDTATDEYLANGNNANNEESEESENENEHKKNGFNDLFEYDGEVENKINVDVNFEEEMEAEEIEEFLRSAVPSTHGEENDKKLNANNYVRSNSKIDNIFNSNYDDLFFEIDFDKGENVSADIFEGSTYMYSKQYMVPVIDLFGFCECDEEDV